MNVNEQKAPNDVLLNPNLNIVFAFLLFWNRIVRLKYNLLNRSLSHLFSALLLPMRGFHSSNSRPPLFSSFKNIQAKWNAKSPRRASVCRGYSADVTVKSHSYLFFDKHSVIIVYGRAYCNHRSFDRDRFVRVWFIFPLFGHNDISMLPPTTKWLGTQKIRCLPSALLRLTIRFVLTPSTNGQMKWAN